MSTLTLYLQSLPISNSNYGLIHYDFQLDNLFYEEKHYSFNVIDFDDSVYSWYAHDIVTALNDFLDDDMKVDHSPVKSFLEGYRSIRPLSEKDVTAFPYFQRFMKLYQFSKLLWTLEGSDIVDAPQWLDDLKLKARSCKRSLERGV